MGASHYGTQSRNTYIKHEGVKANKAFNPALQKTNFTLGNCPPVTTSSYTRDMQQYKPANYNSNGLARD